MQYKSKNIKLNNTKFGNKGKFLEELVIGIKKKFGQFLPKDPLEKINYSWFRHN